MQSTVQVHGLAEDATPQATPQVGHSETVAARYAAVFLDLPEWDLALLWDAVLFRRPLVDGRLRDRLAALERLRDEVGRASAARNRNADAGSDAA